MNVRREPLLRLLEDNPKCGNCGYNKDIRALQIHHVFKDGYQDRQYFKSFKVMVDYYKENQDIAKKRLCILCANCHSIETHENDNYGRKIPKELIVEPKLRESKLN